MNTILITGADGYLGRLLAEALLINDSHQLFLWVRGNDEKTQSQKKEALSSLMAQYPERVRLFFGDLTDASPFLKIDCNQITHIIHCAAVTHFNVAADEADAINIGGTRKILQFAAQCQHLQHFHQISTLYSSGLTAGAIDAAPFKTVPEFANHYERSKYEAEKLAYENFAHLPITVHRLATVIAHNNDGKVIQYNVFHNTIRLLYNGLISLLPGHADTPLYFVTGQFCQQAILQQLTNPEAIGKTYHICFGINESLTLGELIEVIFSTFAKDSLFLKRRILKPLLVEKDAFLALAEAVDKGVGGALVQQAVNSIAPFADQLFIRKVIHSSHYTDLTLSNHQQLVKAVCTQLIRTQWGLRKNDENRI